jgi:hypothetical protein
MDVRKLRGLKAREHDESKSRCNAKYQRSKSDAPHMPTGTGRDLLENRSKADLHRVIAYGEVCE